MHYIAEAEREKLKDAIQNAQYLSIMSDSSTDSSAMEEELVYVRFATAGKTHVHFVGVQSVQKPDATHITDAVKHLMDSVSVNNDRAGWLDKLVACATDGASVMTGLKKGVVTQLRQGRPYILGIHCVAHRLELAFSDAFSKNNMTRKVEELLSGLYTFYKKSCLNRANLKQGCKEVGMTALMPTRIGGTRWVSHILQALDKVLRGYRGLMHHLDQVSYKLR